MKLDEGGQIYGALALLRHVRALEKESGGVRGGDADIEYIHRMRVASRRLRAALPLFSACLPAARLKGWEKEIRAITRALGEARDTDVQIEHVEAYREGLEDAVLRAGLARLALRLRQKRSALQPGLNKALDGLSRKNTLAEMSAALEPLAARAEGVTLVTPALLGHGAASIGARLDELVAYDAIVPFPEKVEELHAMRIAAKRLRYTLETFAPIYAGELKAWLRAVRDTQETLGTIHDCDVWGTFIPLYLAEELKRVEEYFGNRRPYQRLVPGVEQYARARQAEREELYRGFVRQWMVWTERDLWGRLRLELSGGLETREGVNNI